MTLYLFSLLMVTTHALHLMSLWSNHHHRSKSLTAPCDMLHLIFGTMQLPTSLRVAQPNYSPPSFVHAGLTCYTLLSPSITFSLFHSSAQNLSVQKIILHSSLFLSVGLISWLFEILVFQIRIWNTFCIWYLVFEILQIEYLVF